MGTIDVRPGSTESMIIDIAIDDAGPPHPWGIYDQATCEMPPPNHDSPFQFADVEKGHQTEEIEAAPYLSFAHDLVAVVFSAQGSSVYGCALLGPPTAPQNSPRPVVDCSSSGVASPGAARSEIAFARDVLADSEIFVMNEDGSDVRRLTTSLGLDIKPSWAPDGRQIAFRSQRDGNDEIYIMNADGSCPRNLTAGPADDRSPAWSPDGKSIAFDHFFKDAYQDVAVIDVDGSHMRQVTTASGEYPAWSPDGRRLAFASARSGNYEIYVIDVDGTHETRITANGGYDMYPAWSPDGKWIAYEHGVDGFDASMEIHMIRPDGTDHRQVTHNETNDRFPAWSSSGKLAWSESGAIMIAASPETQPVEVGKGQFPAWWP